MVNWIAISKEESEVFVELTSVEELRARRVWKFLLVTWLTWLVNGIFLWYRGYHVAAAVCLIDFLVHLAIVVSFWNNTKYRRVMNLNLAASGIGLFCVSISDPAMAVTILYCPVSIVVASQVVGVRAAFYWLVTNLVAFVLFYTTAYGIYNTFYTWRFDEFVLVVGIAVCTFFCCQQGEQYYQLRIRNLIKLSQDLEKKSERLHHLATTDALTGLINRFQFQEKLRERVAHARAESERMALFLLDMDGFKEINDTLGHPLGDKTLVEIASRLTAAFADRSDVARLGGDEFCVIYPQFRDRDAGRIDCRGYLQGTDATIHSWTKRSSPWALAWATRSVRTMPKRTTSCWHSPTRRCSTQRNIDWGTRATKLR